MLLTSYHRSTNCTVLESSVLFSPHLKQGFDLFILEKELGVFIDFTVQTLQAKPDFFKDYEVNVSLIAIIKSRGFVSAELLLFLCYVFLGNKTLCY